MNQVHKDRLTIGLGWLTFSGLTAAALSDFYTTQIALSVGAIFPPVAFTVAYLLGLISESTANLVGGDGK